MTTFNIHLDFEDGVVWWAETDAIDGFTAAADSLVELRQLITEAAALYLEPGTAIELRLVASEPVEVTYRPVVEGAVAVPDAAGASVVRAFPAVVMADV